MGVRQHFCGKSSAYLEGTHNCLLEPLDLVEIGTAFEEAIPFVTIDLPVHNLLQYQQFTVTMSALLWNRGKVQPYS